MMANDTGIPWCDSTFNPWWGCVEVSDECARCYAREFDTRFNGEHWGKDKPRRFFGDKHWNEPRRWNKSVVAGRVGKDGRRWLVFCSSMADVFETNETLDAQRERLWQLIRETPALTWLMLTKRPQNIGRMVPSDLIGAPHIWYGTTVGVRSSLWRIDALIEHAWRAPVRFLSMEPLLEDVSGQPFSERLGNTPYGINWAIIGSESGDGARQMDTDWARRIVAECRTAKVSCFMKQADLDAPGISVKSGPLAELETGRNAPYRRRDLRMGPDGIRRTHWIIERPFIDGEQHVEWPA
jgi:protein gp37